MIKEQLKHMEKDALIDMILTVERTSNNWEEIAELRRQSEINLIGQLEKEKVNSTRWRNTADRRKSEIEELDESIKILHGRIEKKHIRIDCLKDIEHDQLIEINRLKSSIHKIASNLEITQQFTNNVIS